MIHDIRFPAMALTIGPWMFVKGFTEWRRRRLLADTPTSKIRSMAMGLVEVNGTVTPRSAAHSPFSGKECVFWQVDVSTRSRNGWTVIHRESSTQPFYIRDETGLALVFPAGAECKLDTPVQEVCNGLALPECYADYMRLHGSVFGSLARLGEMRFREVIVEEDRQLFILGTASPKARATEIGDGEVFEATGTDDPGAVALRAARLHGLDGEVRATIRQGENQRAFLISEKSESEVMSALGTQSTLFVIVGPVLTLLGIAYCLFAWFSGSAH